ncbi:hypothetical protein WJX74_002111 [Apatococcus lobatus]|uniref:Uncharacterized protein n=1 Tax=Apatococcus lobatus TaxID=904363 RepID=A0AAW1RSS8_9CHLO
MTGDKISSPRDIRETLVLAVVYLIKTAHGREVKQYKESLRHTINSPFCKQNPSALVTECHQLFQVLPDLLELLPLAATRHALQLAEVLAALSGSARGSHPTKQWDPQHASFWALAQRKTLAKLLGHAALSTAPGAPDELALPSQTVLFLEQEMGKWNAFQKHSMCHIVREDTKNEYVPPVKLLAATALVSLGLVSAPMAECQSAEGSTSHALPDSEMMEFKRHFHVISATTPEHKTAQKGMQNSIVNSSNLNSALREIRESAASCLGLIEELAVRQHMVRHPAHLRRLVDHGTWSAEELADKSKNQSSCFMGRKKR